MFLVGRSHSKLAASRILYYLRFDTLLALGTMATVALLVLARIQNLFITFFGAVGAAPRVRDLQRKFVSNTC